MGTILPSSHLERFLSIRFRLWPANLRTHTTPGMVALNGDHGSLSLSLKQRMVHYPTILKYQRRSITGPYSREVTMRHQGVIRCLLSLVDLESLIYEIVCPFVIVLRKRYVLVVAHSISLSSLIPLCTPLPLPGIIKETAQS